MEFSQVFKLMTGNCTFYYLTMKLFFSVAWTRHQLSWKLSSWCGLNSWNKKGMIVFVCFYYPVLEYTEVFRIYSKFIQFIYYFIAYEDTLVQIRMPLAIWAWCWLMFSQLLTSTPRPFSARQLSSHSALNLNCFLRLQNLVFCHLECCTTGYGPLI